MWRDERGMALVLVLLCSMLFLALGGALVTVVSTEATISATFRDGAVALAAADAAIVRVIADLATMPNLDAALSGVATSDVHRWSRRRASTAARRHGHRPADCDEHRTLR